jgi:uncharacterized membrane protein YciS (DUF1049 family)
MFRWVLLLLLIMALAFGLFVGALNPQDVAFDLLWVQGQSPLGVLLLVAFISGGAVTWVFSTLTRWMRLKQQR